MNSIGANVRGYEQLPCKYSQLTTKVDRQLLIAFVSTSFYYELRRNKTKSNGQRN